MRLKIGAMFAIPDEKYKCEYLAVAAEGGDFIFLNSLLNNKPDLSYDKTVLFRVFVSYASTNRSKWRKLSLNCDLPEAKVCAIYLQNSVGGISVAVNGCSGMPELGFRGDYSTLEIISVWDAEYHILPVLRHAFWKEYSVYSEHIAALRNVI